MKNTNQIEKDSRKIHSIFFLVTGRNTENFCEAWKEGKIGGIKRCLKIENVMCGFEEYCKRLIKKYE